MHVIFASSEEPFKSGGPNEPQNEAPVRWDYIMPRAHVGLERTTSEPWSFCPPANDTSGPRESAEWELVSSWWWWTKINKVWHDFVKILISDVAKIQKLVMPKKNTPLFYNYIVGRASVLF